tara:strand:+ start:331 stop:663 length:333 start_codon:yes stop_codon:yes gene_type:complete
MFRFIAPAFAALGIATIVGFTPIETQAYTILGSVDCPDVVREDEDESFRLANQFWVLGYITARNFGADADVGTGVEDDVIYGMMLAFCKKNPNNDMDDAANRVYEILSNL